MKDHSIEVSNAVQTLAEGGIIVYPTDTIWGIGCDAVNVDAVDKIISVKQRAPQQSMIIIWHDMHTLNRFTKVVPDDIEQIIDSYTGPVTIIYPKGKNLAPNVLHTDGSIAIRITQHPFCADLLKQLDKPIVSTSANFSGQAFPSSFNDISDDILNRVDYIVDLPNESPAGTTPSSIIKIMDDGEIHVIREAI